MTSESSGIYGPRCNEVQHQDGVRFAAIIDKDGEKILLVSAEPGLDIEKLAENVVKIFTDDSLASD